MESGSFPGVKNGSGVGGRCDQKVQQRGKRASAARRAASMARGLRTRLAPLWLPCACRCIPGPHAAIAGDGGPARGRRGDGGAGTRPWWGRGAGTRDLSVLSLQLSVMLQLVQNLKFKKSYFA